MRIAAGAVVAACAALVGCTAVEEADAPPTTLPEEPATTIAPLSTTTSTTTPLADLEAVDVDLQEIARVDQPTAMAARAGDPALYVIERPGRVRRIEIATTSRRPRASTTPTTAQAFQLERSAVLDIADDVEDSGQEQGLLGIAFSTDGNRLYLAFTGNDDDQHLVEFRMGAERPDPGSRRELLVVEDFASNHNGGQLAFGPDGYLYWGMGDGGGDGDPRGTGQDPGDLLGSVLRIDPDVLGDAPEPYAVPPSNPFATGGGAPEVWAYGLRNPWRFSFDRATGDLWIADVGQGDAEEIDHLPASGGVDAGRGANLGWSAREGNQAFEGGDRPQGAVEPILAYGHGDGRCSVTGGYVYRGQRVPRLVGAYLYGDYCEGQVRALTQRGGEVVDDRELGLSVPQLSSFGEDVEGELYVLSLEGPVFRIVPATP